MRQRDIVLFPFCLMGVVMNGYWIIHGDTSIMTVIVLIISSMGSTVGLLNIVENHYRYTDKITGSSMENKT